MQSVILIKRVHGPRVKGADAEVRGLVQTLVPVALNKMGATVVA